MSGGYFLTIDSHLGLTLSVSVMKKSIVPIRINQTMTSKRPKFHMFDFLLCIMIIVHVIMCNQDVCEESSAMMTPTHQGSSIQSSETLISKFATGAIGQR